MGIKVWSFIMVGFLVSGCGRRPPEKCSVEQLDAGAQVTCGDSTVVVPNGVDGKDGLNGVDGRDGLNGVDGRDGLNGTNGIDGKDGKDGLNGTNGIDGKDGLNGTNGIDGKDGKDGLNGANGTNGADGKDGASCQIREGILDNAQHGAWITCGDSEVFLSDGMPGEDAVSLTVVDPCGDTPNVHDEVLLVFSDGTVLSSFSDSASGANTRFSTLREGVTYITTDGTQCRFAIEGGVVVTR